MLLFSPYGRSAAIKHPTLQTIQFGCVLVEFVVRFIRMSAQHRVKVRYNHFPQPLLSLLSTLRADVSLLHGF